MKLLLILVFFFYLLPCYSQKADYFLPKDSAFVLFAKNSKRSRFYLDKDILKLHYHAGDKVIKTKGKLFILEKDSVQIIPYGRKRIVTISVTDIVSIGKWSLSHKIVSAAIGVTGIAAIIAAQRRSPNRGGVAEGNFAGLGLIIYSAMVLWYEIVDIPIFLLNERLSIRSTKRGYHFYIETHNINKIRHWLR